MSWQMLLREKTGNTAIYFLIDKEVLKLYIYACQLPTNVDGVVY